MPQNPIQFQHGMSLTEFIGRYGTEDLCKVAQRHAHWPAGFVCPACGEHMHSSFVSDGRR